MFSVFKHKPHYPSYEKFRNHDSTSIDARESEDASENHLLPGQAPRMRILLTLSWLGSILLAFGLGIILAWYHINVGRCQESDLAWGKQRERPFIQRANSGFPVQALRRISLVATGIVLTDLSMQQTSSWAHLVTNSTGPGIASHTAVRIQRTHPAV